MSWGKLPGPPAFAYPVNFAALYYSSTSNAEGTDKSPQPSKLPEESDTKLVVGGGEQESQKIDFESKKLVSS